MLKAAEREIAEITTTLVINNITREKLRYIAVDDLITVNKNINDEITDIDFKLDVAYDMLLDLRADLDIVVYALKDGVLPFKNMSVINDNLIIKIPFYTYTQNPILMNLGPKIHAQVNLLQTMRGSIDTKISSYGINSVLISLYLNLYITQTITLPTNRENTHTDFEILLASRVIQGKVPSFYAGKYETNSGLIHIE